MIGQGQAVGGQAQGQVGQVRAQQLERAQGARSVVQCVARAGNADDGKLGQPGGDVAHLGDGLLRGQAGGYHAGPAFVGAIVFSVAVVALDVATRRHRHMHAGEVVVGVLGIAGVRPDPRQQGRVHDRTRERPCRRRRRRRRAFAPLVVRQANGPPIGDGDRRNGFVMGNARQHRHGEGSLLGSDGRRIASLGRTWSSRRPVRQQAGCQSGRSPGSRGFLRSRRDPEQPRLSRPRHAPMSGLSQARHGRASRIRPRAGLGPGKAPSGPIGTGLVRRTGDRRPASRRTAPC